MSKILFFSLICTALAQASVADASVSCFRYPYGPMAYKDFDSISILPSTDGTFMFEASQVRAGRFDQHVKLNGLECVQVAANLACRNPSDRHWLLEVAGLGASDGETSFIISTFPEDVDAATRSAVTVLSMSFPQFRDIHGTPSCVVEQPFVAGK